MTKAEMELHWSNYTTILEHARTAVREFRFEDAIKLAVDAWPFVDGMMQWEKKSTGRTFQSVEAFDIVLRYSPIIFDHQTLDRFEEFITSQKKIDRRTEVDELSMLDEARKCMRAAKELWDAIDRNKGMTQATDQSESMNSRHWATILVVWRAMGLIGTVSSNESGYVYWTTDMSVIVECICPLCGHKRRDSKLALLTSTNCTQCTKEVDGVLLV